MGPIVMFDAIALPATPLEWQALTVLAFVALPVELLLSLGLWALFQVIRGKGL